MTARHDRSDEGGEAACFLDLVCPECGAVREGRVDHVCARRDRAEVRRPETPGG